MTTAADPRSLWSASSISLVAGALATMGHAFAQSSDGLRIVQFFDQGPVLEIVLEDLEGGPSGHLLEFAAALDRPANPWSVVAGATFTTLSESPTRRSTAVSWPEGTQGFFRIRRIDPTTDLDTDGDGLTDDVERLLGTDPTRADTDGDSFGDRLEQDVGSDPLIPLSKPAPDQVPVVSFAAAESVVEEGHGIMVIPLTITGPPYFGDVAVGVDRDFSTAHSDGVTPDYLPLPAKVRGAGNRAELQIEVPDDLEIRPVRTLFIDILSDPGAGYVRGGRSRHTVRLEDNDAFWVGTLRRAYETADASQPRAGFAELQFRMRIVRQGERIQASLTGGGSSSLGNGLVPQGNWPLSIDSLAVDRVALVTTDPLPVAATRLFGEARLSRRLSLTADRATARFGFDLQPRRWIGDYRLELLGGAGSQHLVNRPEEGLFILIQELPEQASPRL